MKRLLIISLLLCSILLIPNRARAYTEVPVLLHLYMGNQIDTNGFNLVAEMPKLLYSHIMDGSLTLWDSPKKQVRISPQALQSIESSSKTEFSQARSIFMNELWSSTRRKTQFVIIGFSFMNDNGKDKVSYGYIDAREAFYILSSNLIPCNVNGPAELSYWNALYSRKYVFSLVQFGNNNFTDKPSESEVIRNKAYNGKKKIIGAIPIPQTKMLTYSIEKNNEDPDDPAGVLFKGFDEYLNTNREMFFELGGSKYFDYKTYKSELAVTRIEVCEVWQKLSKDHIGSSIKYVTVFVNNKPLNPLSSEDLDKLQLLFRYKTPEDIIKERLFRFNLVKCNDTYIAANESARYLRALQEFSWSQVSNYIKFSEN